MITTESPVSIAVVVLLIAGIVWLFIRFESIRNRYDSITAKITERLHIAENKTAVFEERIATNSKDVAQAHEKIRILESHANDSKIFQNSLEAKMETLMGRFARLEGKIDTMTEALAFRLEGIQKEKKNDQT